jgi:hypothetical protein
LGNDQHTKSRPTIQRKRPTTRQGFHLSSLGIGDCGLLIGEMVLRHGVMRKCIKKLSENAKSFLAAYLRMKSPFRNPNSVCSYRLFPIKSTTFAFLHDLFPRRQICEKKCLQISILQGILPPNIVKDSTKSAQPNVFLSPSQRGGAQPEAESCMRGVALEDASCLSLFLNELSGLAKRKPAVSCTGIVEGLADLRSREWIFPAT